MTQAQLKTTLGKVINKVAIKAHVQVYTQFNLREPRINKQYVASKNPGWTLYINKKGSLCHAVHKTGSLLLLEAPDYYNNCFHDEHVTNYFVNHIRSIAKGV